MSPGVRLLFVVALALVGGCRSAGDRGEFDARLADAQRARASGDAARFDQASAAAESALPDGDADGRARLGALYLDEARRASDARRSRWFLERGAGEFELALASRPDATEWRFDAGLAALRLEQPSRAIAHLERVQREAPGDMDARLLLARAYLGVGDDRAAADTLEPSGPPGREAERLELRGIALLLLGESRSADDSFTRALAAGACPTASGAEARILCNRALARRALGDSTGARADYAMALKAEPRNARASEGLAALP